MSQQDDAIARHDAPDSELDALKSAHLELMERQANLASAIVPTGGETKESKDEKAELERTNAAFLDACEAFIASATAAGAALDDDDERLQAQSLINYWSTRLIRGGRGQVDTTLREFDITHAPKLEGVASPYRGLAPFREGDAEFFFGRSTLIDSMIERIRSGQRLLAIVGSSGSGKSSAVMAGLIPKLKNGAVDGSSSWGYASMVPGAQPLANLQRALNESAETPFVLVVDQFEEVFTLCADDAARSRFVEAIQVLVQEPEPRNVIVLTMRVEYADAVAKLADFWPLFLKARLNADALSADELHEAIEGPARMVGLKFEDGIVDDLVNTILGEQAGLPLLQFALWQLWQAKQGHRITWAVYREVGNPLQALERSAEKLYGGLLPEQQEVARRIFLKLVRPSPSSEFTSNRIPRSAAFAKNMAPDRVERVLNRLIDARLIRETPGANADEVQIEVAHEALVRNWQRLVDWLNDEREALRERFRLEEEAARWHDRGRDPALLLRGRPLEEAELVDDISAREREFISASRAATDAAVEAERRANRRLRLAQVLLASCVVIFLFVMVLGYLLLERTRSIELESKRLALKAELEVRNGNTYDGLVIAREAISVADTSEAQISLRQTLRQAPQRSFLLLADSAINAFAPYPDSSKFIAVDKDNNVNIWDVQAGGVVTPVLSHLPPDKSVVRLRLLQNGSQVWILLDDGESRILNIESGETVSATLAATERADIAPDGQKFVTVDTEDGILRLWDTPTSNRVLEAFGDAGVVRRVRFSPRGDRIVAALSDGTARVWDTANGSPILPTIVVTGVVLNDAQISPDGTLIATAGDDGRVHIFHANNGTEPSAILAEASQEMPVSVLQFSSDSMQLVSAGEDGVARIWNPSSGQLLRKFVASNKSIVDAHFTRDNRQLLTVDGAGRVSIWNSRGGAETGEVLAHAAPVALIRFAPDGSRLLTVSDNAASVWSATSGELLAAAPAVTFPHPQADGAGGVAATEVLTAAINDAQFSPSGARFITAGTAGAHPYARVWDALTAQPVLTLTGGHTDFILGVAHPDEGRALTASGDGTVRAWDTADGTSELVLHFVPTDTSWTIGPAPEMLDLTPDGKRLIVAGSDGKIRIWDVGQKENVPIQAVNPDASLPIQAVALSSDGQRALAVAPSSEGSVVHIWDVAPGAQIRKFPVDGYLSDASFSPDGAVVMTTSSVDGLVRFWRGDTFEPAGVPIGTTSRGGVPGVPARFAPDGVQVAVADGREVRLHWLTLQGLRAEAERRLRGLTLSCADQRRLFDPQRCPAPTLMPL